MSFANDNTSGSKHSNGSWQLSVLQLLGQISTGVGNIPGVDYETRTTTYKAIAAGPGYSINDILVRYDIIDVNTGIVATTVWFNQTTQLVIAAPAPANIVPIEGATSVTVINGPGAAAVNVQDGGNSLTIDNANLVDIDNILTNVLDVLLSSRASEFTLSALNAKFNSLGQKTAAASAPVVLASDQSAIPVTLPTGVSRVPSVQLVPANTVLSNTTAGVKQVSMRVSGGNGQIDGVAIPNGTILTYTATSENDTVGSISYQTGAGTTILITYLT